MTTNAQRADDWTSTELARFSVDACYADLIRETLGGEREVQGRWLSPRPAIYACDDITEVEAVHRWLVEHGEQVARDAERVLDHLAGLRASAEADAADEYDRGCGAR
mgnify:CR=1 FL=1